MEQKLSLSNFYNHPRFWRHAILWIIFLAFYLPITFSSIIENSEKQLVLTYLLLFFQAFSLIYCCFYFYNSFFKNQKYLYFIIGVFFTLSLVSSVDVFFKSEDYGFKLFSLNRFWASMIVYSLLLLTAFAIKLTYNGLKQLERIKQLEKEQIESELQLLKLQVNPHFLFNTLNNIYSINLSNHDKANNIILGLSDLLRYQLDSHKKKIIPLCDEISILENYIQLEKVRVKECEINISKIGDFEKVQIVPLLLLPFVENAFKYGTGIGKGKIDISFVLKENNIFSFSCSNKILQNNNRLNSSGIGLPNVKKRLELVYEKKYKLIIKHDTDMFNVELEIIL